jgi:hypothetical protein
MVFLGQFVVIHLVLGMSSCRSQIDDRRQFKNMLLNPKLNHLKEFFLPQLISVESIVLLACYLCLNLPSNLVSTTLLTERHSFLVRSSFHLPWFHSSNNIRWGVQITRLFIVSFSSCPCYFITVNWANPDFLHPYSRWQRVLSTSVCVTSWRTIDLIF